MAKKKLSFQDLIVAETSNYFVINKPPFISCLDDRNDDINIKILAQEYHENAQLCHRLDKDTSGILVISKNEDAYRNMAIQLEKRTVEKIYHAVVDGLHEIDGIQVEAPIAHRSGSSRVKVDFSDGKPSTTLFKTEKLFKRHTLVLCKPLTGRMHQIRIHLSHIKKPILCDKIYGGQSVYLSDLKKNYKVTRGEEEQPLIKRFALHASSIKFKDLNGDILQFEAPYPKDYRVLIKQLTKYI